MRWQRLGFILIAVYVVLVGGSPYYYTIFPIRVITHIIYTLIFGAWLIQRLRRRRGLPSTALNLPLLAAVLVWGVSIIFSLSPRMALENAWMPYIHLLIFFVLAGMFQAGRQRLVWEAQFMLAALVVILAGVQFGSFLFGWGITPETRVGWLEAGQPPLTPMLYMPLGVSTWLAGYTAPLALLAFAWGRTARSRDERIVLYALAALLMIVLIGTTSRGGLLALAAAAGGFVLLRAFNKLQGRRMPFSRRWLFAAAGILAGAAVVIAVVVLIGRSQSRSSGDVLRLNLWQTAVEIAAAYPLTGVGVGEFGHAARLYRDPAVVDDRLGSAHNIILNTAAETGILGVLVLGWLAAAVVVGWWRLRRRADAAYALRLDAALAALGAIAVQSMVDTFTTTPIVVLIALLAAYSVVPVKKLSAQDAIAAGKASSVGGQRARMVFALLALALLLVYGGLWLVSDRAQARMMRAAQYGEIAAALDAAALDPALNLYDLQIAHLTGRQAQNDPSLLDEAVRLYRAALDLEPTWDTGWINLAGLLERQGRYGEALAALERAEMINFANGARFNWARIAEAHDLADDGAIIDAYFDEISRVAVWQLPLSTFWVETPLRLAATERFYQDVANGGQRRRIAAVHFPERLAELPDVPPDLSRGDGWVEAARLELQDYDPTASYHDDPLARIERMLNHGELMGSFYESPNAVRALIAERLDAPLETVNAYRFAALPPLVFDQNFEGVLFGGRIAGLDILPSMRFPSGGYPLFAPYYAAAESYELLGDFDRAAQIYRYIVNYAPDETLARERLAGLEAEQTS